MENIITVNNVTKTFGRDTVLHDVTVQFERGKIHGLVGRNGSGKTVLLKCICGFIAPTEGSIRVRNKVVGRDEQVPENLCGIIETPGFLPGYSGYSNLKFLASIQNKTPPMLPSQVFLGLTSGISLCLPPLPKSIPQK